MMIIRSLFHITIAAIALSVNIGTAHAQSLVVFGDSLSDTGNLASVPGRGPFPPPFYLGSRVSNGPVAVEVAAGLLGETLEPSLHLIGQSGGLNYAVAGARAAGGEPIDLPTQVGAFLLPRGGVAPADKTYIMLIGGNDIRDARDTTDGSPFRIIRDAVDGIELQLNTLISAGARSIMVVNSADISAIPETIEQAVDRDGRRKQRRAKWLTFSFNNRLARVVRKIERTAGVDLVLLDIDRIVDNIVDDASARQFSNTTEACVDTRTFQFNDACAFGANFDQFVFFDQIHPSARTHEIAGKVIFAYLPVPPAASSPAVE